jgi:methylenetetrahydrofolate dehydrogenase (NADP+)/methenyltetrahydrofolate cyclohydrolase
VKKKGEICEKARIDFELVKLEGSTSEADVLRKIDELNSDKEVAGILIQLPLPEHISRRTILNAVLPEKDVDGLTSFNLGCTLSGKENVSPATPKGIIRLLEEYGIAIRGKQVVIINDSILVGKPLAAMMLNRKATVTVCNRSTKNIKEHTEMADILVVAVGKPGIVTSDMIKEGAVIIDVGICRVGGKVCGDVSLEGLESRASFVTPVPGGVGPMTVVMVLENLVELKLKN